MNRREFLMMSAAASAVAGTRFPAFGAGEEVPPPKVDHKNVKPRNRRPYSGLDWTKAHQINGTTHMHQERNILEVIRKRRIGFLTMTNYYPSKPVYPWREAVHERRRAVADWPIVVNGKPRRGPFDWNKIVAGWSGEISEKDRKLLPLPAKLRPMFKPGDFPADMLEAPNAEHHHFLLANGKGAGPLHLCAPGSAFISGTPGIGNRWRLGSHGYCPGSGEFWGTAIDRMIEKLIIPDGGGVTINHPTWSRHKREFLLELLDWDPRVLGLEVLESGCNSENCWDWVLSTGRQCYGFFVPDHGVNKEIFGISVLVVPERTQEACLRAYRNGDFYGAAHGLGELKFTSISFDGMTARATTDKPAKLEIVTARGVRKTVEGTSVEWTCPDAGNRQGPEVEIFVRIRATALDGCGETLYSQAGMLIP